MGKNRKDRPFGLRDKLGYMFGDFGNDFTFMLSSSWLLKFYTDVMNVPALAVGIVMALARVVDAFTDVAMGRICDRSAVTSAGKFRVWIRRMCAPVAIASFLIYQSGLAGLPMAVKIAYLFVTYILWGSIFYTSINIPYGSMVSAISADPGDRQSLSTFRTMGGVLAGLVIGITVPIVAYDKIDGNEVLNGGRFTVLAGVFSLLTVCCYLLCYALTTERVTIETREDQKRADIRTMLKNAVHNRPLISIIVASIMMLLSQLTMQQMSGYVYPCYYKNTDAQAAFSVIMLVGMVLAAVVSKPLARKFGKAEVSVMSNLAAMAVCLILFFLRPQNVWIYVGLQTLNWFGLGVFSMVIWALITDVVDYSEIRNGIREDGTVYALYSFSRKLGQAAAAGLSGLLLTMVGYSAETAFLPEVADGIYSITTLVPSLGFGFLAAVLAFWYPLRKADVDRNAEILKEKRAGQEEKQK